MEPWDVQLLGVMRVYRGGEEAKFRTRSTASIFAYLALHAGSTVLRETLVALEWPESPNEQGRQSLRTALTSLRQVFGGEALETDRASVRLVPSGFRIDVHEFRRTQDPGLYRGRLLDRSWFQWAIPASLALQDEFLRAVLVAMDRANPEEARKVGAHALELEPGLLAVRARLRDLNGTLLPRSAPLVTTSFVGRQEELQQIENLLRDHRLVTLTGLGGSGKSRLAAEIWRRNQPYSWFVRLADLTDPGSVPEAIRLALGMPPSASRSALEQIAEIQEGVLILDSFDHLIGAGPLVSDLLARCPALRILITSQLTLRLDEEIEVAVGPLRLDSTPSEAMLLFEERARAVVPDFALSAENSGAVAELCERLDGFPLALELAAARSRVFNPAEMLSQLEDRFGFLSRGASHETRRSSLRATLDWSFERLPEQAQGLLTQLSIFRGGFTLQAVAEVCGCREPAGLIDSLLAHSWIQRISSPDQTRFRLLESIREFCAEMLRPSEREMLFERHAEFFLALAARTRAASFSANEQIQHRLVAADVHNLNAAWGWHLANQPEGALLLAETLNWYWILDGQAALGESRIKQALAVADSTPRALLTAAHHTCGNYILFQGRFGDSIPWFQQGYKLAVETGDALFQGFTLGQIGHAQAELGDHKPARRNAKASLQHFIDCGSANWIAAGYTMLALVANRRGDFDTAREMAMLGVEQYTAAEYPWGRASALNELAMAYHLAKRFEEARKFQEESIDIKRRVAAIGSLALSLSDLAATLVRQGEYLGALAAIQECLRNLESTGDFGRFPRLFGVAAEIMLTLGDGPGAVSCLATMRRLTRGRQQNLGEREAENALKSLSEDDLELAQTQPIEWVAKSILSL